MRHTDGRLCDTSTMNRKKPKTSHIGRHFIKAPQTMAWSDSQHRGWINSAGLGLEPLDTIARLESWLNMSTANICCRIPLRWTGRHRRRFFDVSVLYAMSRVSFRSSKIAHAVGNDVGERVWTLGAQEKLPTSPLLELPTGNAAC